MATLVMYHYVRDVENSAFPNIRALSIDKFKGQLDYLQANYNMVSPYKMVEAALSGVLMDEKDCVLTFDDGFIDHYETVLPEFQKRGIAGAFFPSAVPIKEGKLLDVHKIQHIIGGRVDHSEIAESLIRLVEQNPEKCDGKSADFYVSEFKKADHLDSANVVFIKHLLQYALPAETRLEFADRLFAEYVGSDEKAFASQLYMNLDQIRELHSAGNLIGGHGYRHIWLGKSSPDLQRDEFTRTQAFLAEINPKIAEDWVFCYPYGSHDETTLELMKEFGGRVGLTTENAEHKTANHLQAPRIDTIYLPFSA